MTLEFCFHSLNARGASLDFSPGLTVSSWMSGVRVCMSFGFTLPASRLLLSSMISQDPTGLILFYVFPRFFSFFAFFPSKHCSPFLRRNGIVRFHSSVHPSIHSD